MLDISEEKNKLAEMDFFLLIDKKQEAESIAQLIEMEINKRQNSHKETEEHPYLNSRLVDLTKRIIELENIVSNLSRKNRGKPEAN